MFTGLIKIFRAFSRIERLLFIMAFLVFATTFIFISIDFIERRTTLIAVTGGAYKEGVVGQPIFVNPILASGNDTDRDLTEVLFSSLFDMKESYKVSDDGKTWTIRLKENIFWDDGEPITSDDAIFTIETIQNPDSRSPLFSIWQGIEAERASERELKLISPSPYAFFEDNLKELRPISKHIFGNLPAANLRLSNYNLEPVGSGPFKFDSFKKRNDGFITQYNLVRNDNYFGSKPYLDEFSFRFYEDEKNLVDALNVGAVDGAGGLSRESLTKINIRYQSFNIQMSRYYAIFFNPYANPALADKNVRLALSYAVDKKEIIQKLFGNNAGAVSGPLIPGMEGYAAKVYPNEEFSIDKANQILDLGGWKMGVENIRVKDLGQPAKDERAGSPKTTPTRLEFSLVVPETQFLREAADLIAKNWSRIGVKVNLVVKRGDDIQNDALRTRNYEMIMFGNIFGLNPDLFSFWHSSERFYPGLNLALYENKVADSLIESTRRNLNPETRQTDFASLQSLIIQDSPAVFLFSPYYTYISKPWLYGFDERFIPLPSYRFQNITKWYVKTARVRYGVDK